MPVTIRPFLDDDAEPAAEIWLEAFAALRASADPAAPPDPAELARTAQRYRHLVATDPSGSFVATEDGSIVGLAVSLVRADTFVLSNLAVRPDRQDAGIGHQLLERALASGSTASVGVIFSSSDPRAIHRYVRAGFSVHPAMGATGRPGGRAIAAPLRVATGDPADRAAIDRIDLAVHGRTRGVDLEFLLGAGSACYLDDEGAYAIVTSDRLSWLAATDEHLGRRALAALFSGSVTGTPVSAMWMTAETQWAFLAATDAGAELSSRGSVMIRGTTHCRGAYLPSGVFG